MVRGVDGCCLKPANGCALGMGNRFFTMTGYHGLIKAHGILAAITFLGLVPQPLCLLAFTVDHHSGRFDCTSGFR